MSLKSTLSALALTLAALAPGLARADHDFEPFDRGHRHDDHCDHRASPAPQPAGRYELRTVQKWVEARYEQVWVPQVCRTKHRRHHRTVCTGGFYEQQLRPGHYQEVQEYVWVATPQHNYYAAPLDPQWPVNGAWTAQTNHGPVQIRVGGTF